MALNRTKQRENNEGNGKEKLKGEEERQEKEMEEDRYILEMRDDCRQRWRER